MLDLQDLCNKYIKILKFGFDNNDIIIKCITSQLYSNFDCTCRDVYKDIDDDSVSTNSKIFLYLQCLAKLSPINYSINKIPYACLLHHQHKQMEFYKSINFNDIDSEYIKNATVDFYHFTNMHKEFPYKIIVPTLKEDFIWHSLLLDNQCYLEYTTNIIGEPMDHVFHMDFSNEVSSSTSLRTEYNNKYRPILVQNSPTWYGCG